jgi:hypothetical protein
MMSKKNMASELTLPKVKPFDVVRQALSAVEAGRDEVLAVDMTRQVKAGLSDREGIYLNFDPEHAVLQSEKLGKVALGDTPTILNE